MQEKSPRVAKTFEPFSMGWILGIGKSKVLGANYDYCNKLRID